MFHCRICDHSTFAAMCILNEDLETEMNDDADVELVVGAKGSNRMFVTKWTLDSLCLYVLIPN